jgi:hypothetical protein
VGEPEFDRRGEPIDPVHRAQEISTILVGLARQIAIGDTSGYRSGVDLGMGQAEQPGTHRSCEFDHPNAVDVLLVEGDDVVDVHARQHYGQAMKPAQPANRGNGVGQGVDGGLMQLGRDV